MIEFTVYPGKDPPNHHVPNSKLFWRVAVYSRKTAMLERFWTFRPQDRGQADMQAAVLWVDEYEYRGRWRKRPEVLGTGFFWHGGLTADVIAHEAVHMASYYLKALSMPLDLRRGNAEENLAYTVQSCVRQICHRLDQLGIEVKSPE